MLHDFEVIDSFPIGGVKADDVAIVCTGKGTLPWMSLEGNLILVETLYSKEVDDTILSPTTVVQQHNNLFKGFTIAADTDHGTVILKLLNRDDITHSIFRMTLSSGL